MSAQEVRGSLGREAGCRKLADQGESIGDIGDGRRRRGHFCAAGGIRRRRGPESYPRTRRTSPLERRAPGRVECPRPQEAGGWTVPAEVRAARVGSSDGCTTHGRRVSVWDGS